MPRPAMDEPSVLEAVLAGYEAEGFDVFVHPSTAVLPAFMKGYSPDAIAMRPDRKIAIEVKSSERQAPDQISRLQELFSHHPEWEFQVFYAPPRSPAVTIGIPTPLAIDTAISQVRELQESDRLSAALIVGWSVLEAVARSLLPNQLGRPQPSTKLVEVLATEGLLTPDEADALRTAAATRNTAAHGQLDVKVEPALLDILISALRTLSDLSLKRHRR